MPVDPAGRDARSRRDASPSLPDILDEGADDPPDRS
jgi:hypothetical protein